MFYRMFLEQDIKKENLMKPEKEEKQKKKEKQKKEEPQPEEEAEEIPEEYICPVTQDIMVDPVIAQDGHTYERKNITEWVEKHGTSPITREPLSKDIIIPNRVLKSQIEQYLASKKDKKPSKPKAQKESKKTTKKKIRYLLVLTTLRPSPRTTRKLQLLPWLNKLRMMHF
jgi:ribosomal protein S25